MRSFNLSLAAKTTAILCAAALFAGCGKDSTSPTVVVPGPRFNFTFLLTGESHSFQFNDVGSWDYACTPHGQHGMTGTIIVAAGGVDSLVHVGPSNSLSFSPQVATIAPGATVRWVNDSPRSDHTVTR